MEEALSSKTGKLHGFEYTRTSNGATPTEGSGWELCDEITGANGTVHSFWRRLVKR